MLINVGLRTDIIAHYSPWLFRRFAEGYAYARNPLFPSRVSRYELAPDRIDGVLFCSKDYAPALSRIREISSRYRTLFHYTLNGYGTETEPLAPLEDRLMALKELRRLVGDKIFWRYDPIFFTARYTAAWHCETFHSLAARVAPYVRGCVVNFAEPSIRFRENVPDAFDPPAEEKNAVLRHIATVCEGYSLPVRMCAMQSGAFPIPRQGCVTLDDVARANGCAFRPIVHRGNRRHCMCIESRDLGWYDSCPTGCTYCNADRDRELVAKNVLRHDPASPLLIGTLEPDDVLIASRQESYLAPSGGQLSLFDR